MTEPTDVLYLECPCCGGEGAYPDKDGLYHDGQSVVCGCPGMVSIDEDDGPWINIDADRPCERCNPPSRRRLTRNERLQGLADRGIDTWEEYRGVWSR